jgi:hypothetical protein
MSVNGIGSHVPPTTTPVRPAADRAAAAAARQAAKADLTAVLSAEERAYFAELERIGPVTYGPKSALRTDAPPPVLGQRIDVRA